MSNRNGRQGIPQIKDVAMEKAVLLGAEKPVRIPIVFKCADCGMGFKTAHFVPESQAPKTLKGFVIPGLCLTCVEKHREDESTSKEG